MHSSRPFHSTLTSLLALTFPLPATASLSDQEAGTQVIYYSGLISDTFVHDPVRYNATTTNNQTHQPVYQCGDNGTYHFGDIAGADVMIGTNPSWDSNPFYFRMERKENAISREQEASVRMSLASTYFVCFKTEWERCSEIVWWPWYYVEAQQLNLSAASVSAVGDVPIAAGDQGPFYAVKGDRGTWASNGTVPEGWNNLFFQRPGNYSAAKNEGCVGSFNIEWNYDLDFSYGINFTNRTATVSLVVIAADGVITVLFEGQRTDSGSVAFGSEVISLLNPAEHPLPKFELANGTGLGWRTDKEGRWHAKSTKSAAGALSPGWIRGYMLLTAIVLWQVYG